MKARTHAHRNEEVFMRVSTKLEGSIRNVGERERFPSGLKARIFVTICGTAEVVLFKT
jgi:hypothetical protein